MFLGEHGASLKKVSKTWLQYKENKMQENAKYLS